MLPESCFFLIGSHTVPGQLSPHWLPWVKGVCVFKRNLPPALLAEWQGSFTCYCSNTGWNGNWIRASTEVNFGEENLLPLMPGLGTCNLSIISPALYQPACLDAKWSVVQKTWDWQRFNDVFNLHCDLDTAIQYLQTTHTHWCTVQSYLVAKGSTTK